MVKPRRSAGGPLLPAHEVALLVLLRQIDVALPSNAKSRLRRWLAGLQPATIETELEISEALREDCPHIPEEAYPVAVLWAHANPRRGRPRRPWDTPTSTRAARRPAA